MGQPTIIMFQRAPLNAFVSELGPVLPRTPTSDPQYLQHRRLWAASAPQSLLGNG